MKNRWKTSAAFELKVCNELSLPFSAVQEHQLNALFMAKHSTMAYKIPDVGYDQKPFDLAVLGQAEAYVLIMYTRRGQKDFYIIDIDDFLAESKNSVRRSLTEARAQEIGIRLTLG